MVSRVDAGGARVYLQFAIVVAVAQLVRAPDCGSGGRGFKSLQPPHFFSKKSHNVGLRVLMVARNLALGGSYSGNVSAIELRQAGILDIVSSDYVPSSIIQWVIKFSEAGAKSPLPEAVAAVSRTLAQITELSYRGEIAVGKRADLVWAAMEENTPVVSNVWCVPA